MFKFTSKFSDDFKTEASSMLNPVLPDDYPFFITEFKVLRTINFGEIDKVKGQRSL